MVVDYSRWLGGGVESDLWLGDDSNAQSKGLGQQFHGKSQIYKNTHSIHLCDSRLTVPQSQLAGFLNPKPM